MRQWAVVLTPGHLCLSFILRNGASEPDSAPGRQLLISIDLKGVLQLRCWENAGAAPVERELHII